MILYSCFLLLAIFIAFQDKSKKELSPYGKWTFSFAFLIKIIGGITFFVVYYYFYGNVELNYDASRFISDSSILHQVFHKSPTDYLKLLFGIGDLEQLTSQYLQNTTHWDTGDSKIINDNRFVIRIHSLIHFISNGQIFIHLMIIAVISTITLKQFYKTIINYSLLSSKIIFIPLLFFPSLLFWSSGILKEPFLFLGLSFFMRALLDKKLKNSRVFYFLISTFILINVKPYVFLIGLLSLIPYYIYLNLKRYNTLGTILILALLITIGTTLSPSSTKKITQIISKKQFDFINVGRGGLHALIKNDFYYFKPSQIKDLKIEEDSVWITEPIDAIIIQKESGIETRKKIHLTPDGTKWFIYFYNTPARSLINVTPINNSSLQLIKNAPESIINSLLRPTPIDPGSKMKYFAFIETILLYTLLFLSILKRRKLSKKEKSILFSISFFILLLSLLIGWTTPILGAIVRYRIPAYLGILFISLILYSPKSSSE